MKNRRALQQASFLTGFPWNSHCSSSEFCVWAFTPTPISALPCVVGAALAEAGRPDSPAASSGHVALYAETAKGYVQLRWTNHIYDIGMPQSSGMKLFKGPLLQKSQDGIWIPTVTSRKPDLSCQDWVTFFPLWVTLLMAGSTCFNIWLMTKVTLESWVTGAVEQVSKPIVGEAKIPRPLQKELWRRLGQKRVVFQWIPLSKALSWD